MTADHCLDIATARLTADHCLDIATVRVFEGRSSDEYKVTLSTYWECTCGARCGSGFTTGRTPCTCCGHIEQTQLELYMLMGISKSDIDLDHDSRSRVTFSWSRQNHDAVVLALSTTAKTHSRRHPSVLLEVVWRNVIANLVDHIPTSKDREDDR